MGVVIGEFVAEPRPLDHLYRPIVAAIVLGALVGFAASLLARAAMLVSALAAIWFLVPGFAVGIALAAVLIGVIVHRLITGNVVELRIPTFVAVTTFFLVGVIQLVPIVATGEPAHTDVSDEGPPTFLVLLDGYPRADTLTELGVDISPFLRKLEARGFDHYPEATSRYTWTFATLTAMTGEVRGFATEKDRLAARASWALPAGFVAIAPPFGGLNFPGVPTLNSVGTTDFEEAMLQRSVLAPVAGDFLMEGLRRQLDRNLDLLAETDERRLFAHLLAPHIPYLYQGDCPAPPPTCWPKCGLFDLRVIESPGPKIDGYLRWLNVRLVESIDQIVADHPDAEIVLFSDHGARVDLNTAEWHRTFLAARTPTRPNLFAESPHPRSILPLLGLAEDKR